MSETIFRLQHLKVIIDKSSAQNRTLFSFKSVALFYE